MLVLPRDEAVGGVKTRPTRFASSAALLTPQERLLRAKVTLPERSVLDVLFFELDARLLPEAESTAASTARPDRSGLVLSLGEQPDPQPELEQLTFAPELARHWTPNGRTAA